jgi:hypothetical protein
MLGFAWMNMKLNSGLLLIACGMAAQPVAASILQSDFSESLDLPRYSSSGPRIVLRTGVALPVSGTILDSTYEVANPNLWMGMLNLSFDSATNILSLTGDTTDNDYQIISITLSNLTFSDGSVVTGITALATGNAAIPNPDVNITPQISTEFTSNSATITYRVPDLNSSKVFNIAQGTDEFQLTLGTPTTTAPVPEPGTIFLASLTLAGLAVIRLMHSESSTNLFFTARSRHGFNGLKKS